MKSFLSSISSLLVLCFLSLLAACGPNMPVDAPPTSTSPSAPVPPTGTQIARSTYPPATIDDLQMIARALTNTSEINLTSYHFVMSTTFPLFPVTVTEGDVVSRDGRYYKVTQGADIQETLILGNTSYCRDSIGKWIVEVADLKAEFAESQATAQAQINEEMKGTGLMGTPIPIPTVQYEETSMQDQLPSYGQVSTDMYDFFYAGEDTVDGVTTSIYVGEENLQKYLLSSLPPDSKETPIQVESDSGKKPNTLSLWIDKKLNYVRKLQSVHQFTGESSFIWGYEYGCGENPHTQPTPTIPLMPDEGTFTMTLIYSRFNDPSITLPKP